MAKIVYRSAVLSDVPQLTHLRVLMQGEVNSVDTSKIDDSFKEISEDYFARSLNDESYFSTVAEVDGQIISANGLVLYKRPPSINGLSGLVGYVTNVYTLPEFRGQGIAGELMKVLIEYAKSKNVAKLHLGATKSGKGVYEKVGFETVKFEALELRF